MSEDKAYQVCSMAILKACPPPKLSGHWRNILSYSSSAPAIRKGLRWSLQTFIAVCKWYSQPDCLPPASGKKTIPCNKAKFNLAKGLLVAWRVDVPGEHRFGKATSFPSFSAISGLGSWNLCCLALQAASFKGVWVTWRCRSIPGWAFGSFLM